MHKNQLLQLCKNIATEAHKGQKRWGGEPYITHPESVANRVDKIGLKCIAWLHDVLEDTKVTAEELLEKEIPIEYVLSLRHLTRRKGQNYKDFILQVREDWMATIVKIADLKDNLKNLKEGSMKDKYRLALYLLESAYSK